MGAGETFIAIFLFVAFCVAMYLLFQKITGSSATQCDTAVKDYNSTECKSFGNNLKCGGTLKSNSIFPWQSSCPTVCADPCGASELCVWDENNNQKACLNVGDACTGPNPGEEYKVQTVSGKATCTSTGKCLDHYYPTSSTCTLGGCCIGPEYAECSTITNSTNGKGGHIFTTTENGVKIARCVADCPTGKYYDGSKCIFCPLANTPAPIATGWDPTGTECTYINSTKDNEIGSMPGCKLGIACGPSNNACACPTGTLLDGSPYCAHSGGKGECIVTSCRDGFVPNGKACIKKSTLGTTCTFGDGGVGIQLANDPKCYGNTYTLFKNDKCRADYYKDTYPTASEWTNFYALGSREQNPITLIYNESPAAAKYPRSVLQRTPPIDCTDSAAILKAYNEATNSGNAAVTYDPSDCQYFYNSPMQSFGCYYDPAKKSCSYFPPYAVYGSCENPPPGPCVPSCPANFCGSDGCKGVCPCPTGYVCGSDNICVKSSCDGTFCGYDFYTKKTCSCPSGQTCYGETCCKPDCSTGCRYKDDGCGGKCPDPAAPDSCGFDGCGNFFPKHLCEEIFTGIKNQVCTKNGGTCCTKDCSKQCGGTDPVCGGSCPNTCPAGSVCSSDNKTCCKLQCEGKCGGPDGCGGTCANSCGSLVCNPATNTCCLPKCDGKCGGDNGCGGTCPNICGTNGNDVCNPATNTCCVPNCKNPDGSNKNGGSDGCGGTCPCYPNCVGKCSGESDGCKGYCPTCPYGYACQNDGACVKLSVVPLQSRVYLILKLSGAATRTWYLQLDSSKNLLFSETRPTSPNFQVESYTLVQFNGGTVSYPAFKFSIYSISYEKYYVQKVNSTTVGSTPNATSAGSFIVSTSIPTEQVTNGFVTNVTAQPVQSIEFYKTYYFYTYWANLLPTNLGIPSFQFTV